MDQGRLIRARPVRADLVEVRVRDHAIELISRPAKHNWLARLNALPPLPKPAGVNHDRIVLKGSAIPKLKAFTSIKGYIEISLTLIYA